MFSQNIVTRTLVRSSIAIMFFCLSAFAQTSDLDRAIEAYRAGNYATSLTILTRLSNGSGANDAMVWNYIGLANIKIDDLDEARKAFLKAVKIEPNDGTIRGNFAFLLLLRYETNEAIENASAAIRLDPKNSGAYFVRAFARQRKLAYDDALSDCETAIGLKSDFASVHLLRADTLLAKFVSLYAGKGRDLRYLDLLDRAITGLETCAKVCSDPQSLDERNRKLDGFRAFARFFKMGYALEQLGENSADSDLTPLKVQFVPKFQIADAYYLPRGRLKTIAVFDVDGKVKSAFVVTPLPAELHEIPLRYLGLIRFKPATRQGKPFPVVKIVEFAL